jgi:hypothetical protein
MQKREAIQDLEFEELKIVEVGVRVVDENFWQVFI